MRRTGDVAGGGAFESEYLYLFLSRGGRITHVELFELDALDAALARFEELRPDPLRVPPNAAMRAYDRWYEAMQAGDWAAVDAAMAPSYAFEDRRRLFRSAHDREAGLLNDRLPPRRQGWRATRTLLATAGDRLALQHIVWATGPADAASEIEILSLDECEDGRFVHTTVFDPGDRAAAHAELFERYVAIGGDGMPARRERVRARRERARPRPCARRAARATSSSTITAAPASDGSRAPDAYSRR